MSDHVHATLPCGIEFAALPLPRRHVVSFQVRVLAGAAGEPAEQYGLARLVGETIDKGTQRRTGQEVSDAFDAIGARQGIGTGRESTTFSCSVLPDQFERAAELVAEVIRTPTFPEDSLRANLELARQELLALEDDPQGLVDKHISLLAYGPKLGHHTVGEPDTLERIRRDDLERYWQRHFSAGRMLVSVAGAIEPKHAADVFQRLFDGCGSAVRVGRETFAPSFTAGRSHHAKDLEQEHIGICWPGVEATDAEFPVQQVILGILSGGMSGRLFTEVREKLALVYWVSAWQETPRGTGMLFLGASTTPERCDKTYATLLREVDRLAEDITEDELHRAVTGIVAQQETRGDSTRSRCAELVNDLFFFGRPMPPEEKIARVQRVTIADIRRYLGTHRRDRLCVVTLGPRPLAQG